MKRVFAVALAAMCFACGAFASNLTEQEVATLKRQINAMFDSFEKGDVEALIDQTHESVFRLTGGREAFENLTRGAIEQLMQSGVRFLESELGTPSVLYSAGSEEVCFIPRTSIMEMQGKKVKSVGFMIAIRPKSGGEWQYLDGSGIRKNRELLWIFLPELTRDVELPENTVELL